MGAVSFVVLSIYDIYPMVLLYDLPVIGNFILFLVMSIYGWLEVLVLLPLYIPVVTVYALYYSFFNDSVDEQSISWISLISIAGFGIPYLLIDLPLGITYFPGLLFDWNVG